MRSLLVALCASLSLAACAGPSVVSLDSLPDYKGDVKRLFLLTPSVTRAAVDSAQPTREAGLIPTPDSVGSGKPAALRLVDGWVVTQHPDLPVGSSSTLTLSQDATGRADKLRMRASRYEDDFVATMFKATFAGERARVRDAYVLNTRYFGLQLTDERFVLFDRQDGHFLDTAVDMHGAEDLVYVDRQGQPYLRRQPDGAAPTPVKELSFPELGLAAPLSPTEVFPVSKPPMRAADPADEDTGG